MQAQHFYRHSVEMSHILVVEWRFENVVAVNAAVSRSWCLCWVWRVRLFVGKFLLTVFTLPHHGTALYSQTDCRCSQLIALCRSVSVLGCELLLELMNVSCTSQTDSRCSQLMALCRSVFVLSANGTVVQCLCLAVRIINHAIMLFISVWCVV